MKKSQLASRIISILLFAITITLLVILYNIYKANDFGDFSRGEYRAGISRFSRDNTHVTESGHRSYRIQSDDFNNAIFFKTLEVKPNTLYRVTAMVKTENVESEDERAGSRCRYSYS